MRAAAANQCDINLLALTGRSDTHVVEQTRPPCRLQPAVLAALLRMRAAAAAAGVDLHPVSSFRDFAHQLRIWNEKYRGQRPLFAPDGALLETASLSGDARVDAILIWSALPGASRHHWGTDLDVIDRACLAPGTRPQLARHEYAPDGCFAALDGWLGEHAARFGFFRPYDIDRGGVQPEPWHLSFAPLALPALRALDVPTLHAALAEADLAGGEYVLPRLAELHARYVLAVAEPDAEALAAPALTVGAI